MYHPSSVAEDKELVNVLFVCLGNICRSPAAEGVFRRQVEARGLAGYIRVDSAGTGDWHIGKAPDPRTIAAGHGRGLCLSGLRARRVLPGDFRRFDYLLAMDRMNLFHLEGLCPPGERHRLCLFLDFAPEAGAREVTDPYCGDAAAFERMFDLIELGTAGLLRHIVRHHLERHGVAASAAASP